jgi:hypothetical protein
MLFDTGTKSNYDVGKFIVVPFLQQKGIKKIDTVVISHEHVIIVMACHPLLKGSGLTMSL